ncbi:MAG: alpha-1,2-fucosyltransferase [bacterium]|nr:alpha-1,2-fucosyltransferase [bacterium]
MSIIVKVVGGLGNQLFQYAFARSVSSRLKTDFKLDINPFSTFYSLHKYSLQHFNVQENLSKDSDFFGFVWLRKQNKAFEVFYRHLRLKRKILPFYYPEQTFHFDPTVFSAKNGTYFEGHWNTEKYFKDIRADLLKELTLKEPLSPYSQSILEKIKNSRAVSIHVRHGDYMTNAGTNSIWGTCSMDYYNNAIKKITEREPSPHFFIFSDDYAWAVENFKSMPYPVTCVNNNADKNYEDITLMSHCKHNIIANSTFSWWGAWLNKNPEKIVIAPERWYGGADSETTDIIPQEWIRV